MGGDDSSHEVRQEARWLHPSHTAPPQAPPEPDLSPHPHHTSSFGQPQIPIPVPLPETRINPNNPRGPGAVRRSRHWQQITASCSAGLTWECTLNFHWYFILLSSSCTSRGCSHTTLTPSTCSDICRGGKRGVRLKAAPQGPTAEPCMGPAASFDFILHPPGRGLLVNPHAQSSSAAQCPHVAALGHKSTHCSVAKYPEQALLKRGCHIES